MWHRRIKMRAVVVGGFPAQREGGAGLLSGAGFLGVTPLALLACHKACLKTVICLWCLWISASSCWPWGRSGHRVRWDGWGIGHESFHWSQDWNACEITSWMRCILAWGQDLALRVCSSFCCDKDLSEFCCSSFSPPWDGKSQWLFGQLWRRKSLLSYWLWRLNSNQLLLAIVLELENLTLSPFLYFRCRTGRYVLFFIWQLVCTMKPFSSCTKHFPFSWPWCESWHQGSLPVMDEILTVSLSSFSEFLPAEWHKVHIMPPLTQIVVISHFLFACIETKTNCGLYKKGCWGSMCGQVETSGRNVSMTGDTGISWCFMGRSISLHKWRKHANWKKDPNCPT